MSVKKLDFSIPANNQKIIELYNKMRKGELDPNPAYQRKLVWRKQHKFKFIQTILLNFPFPEIYLAPGVLDTETLQLKDEIVDGQQRLNTIMNYIEGKGVFSEQGIPVTNFSALEKDEKEAFLNYEVSVRYLKNADRDQVKEIFQRINSTEYSLNKTERMNAQWGDSEFICFGKQVVEADMGIDTDLINYKISPENRELFLDFFLARYQVFNENDVTRMLALQYMLTVLATICEGNYFKRNDRVSHYIETYFEIFDNAAEIETSLSETVKFLADLGLDKGSYWFNKANMFTLLVELNKYDVDNIDKSVFKKELDDLERESKEYGLLTDKSTTTLPADHVRYFEYAKEAVNDTVAREFRGTVIRDKIVKSTTMQA